MVTWGNAMKMDAIVSASGNLNFGNLDPALKQLKDDGVDLYGHNFFWHTQQQQTYLKSLIAPKLVVETDSNIETVLAGDAANFDGGTSGGWGSWGSNKESADVVAGAGEDGSPAMVLVNKGDGNAWEAQFAYTFDAPLEKDVEYTIRFKAKCSSAAGELQFQYQNGTTYGSQGGYNTFNIGTDWATYEHSFTITNFEDVNRIILNFGKVGGTYTIDDIEFGIKQEDPMDNIMVGDASDFEGGSTGGWGSWGSNKEDAAVVEDEAHGGTHSLMLKNKGDGNAWEAQCAYTFSDPLVKDTKYIIQFYAKSSSAAGELQFQYQNGTTYGSQGGYNSFPVGTDWILCEYEFTMPNEDDDRIILNFGKVGGTYWIDDIKFGPAKDQGAASSRRAAKSYYVLKTAEEKKEALTNAMEAWVKGMAEHLAAKEIVPVAYDVINEAIADGSNGVRGYNGVFGGSWTEDETTYYDAAPTETEADGLTLNWGPGHWYWGYFVPDYPVKAFQFARKYLPAETKLFYNDYNLESSDSKRAAAIQFVKDIDAANGSAIVDGIGTQMHVSFSPTDDAEENATKVAELRARVDKMFQELAATGKLVRVTELDIVVGTGSPSAAQYKAQSDAYQTIFESYFENVPEAQQSGITIWSLTDAEDEHEYWLSGQKPNLWDESFKRKWAYKGVCDALAGEDVGLTFGSETYKAYYEKNNVSSTVQ
jgi:GH35 family endo-1,4-beta-xylanase